MAKNKKFSVGVNTISAWTLSQAKACGYRVLSQAKACGYLALSQAKACGYRVFSQAISHCGYLLFLCIVLCVLGTDLFAQSPEEYLKTGKKNYSAGDYKTAMDQFMQVLLEEPDHREAKKYIKLCAEELLATEKSEIEKEKEKILTALKEEIKKHETRVDLKKFYSTALTGFKKKEYLRAYYYFNKIYEENRNYRETNSYRDKISAQMSQEEREYDVRDQAYLRGFWAFFDQDMQKSVNEWQKVLSFDPGNGEVKEFYELAQGKLKERQLQQELEDLKKKEEERVSALLGQLEEKLKTAERDFIKKVYAGAMKSYENVLDTVKKEKDDRFNPKKELAMKGVENTLSEIQKLMEEERKRKAEEEARQARVAEKPVVVEEKKEPPVVDDRKSQEHYVQGLTAYAQGRLRDALREWELSLRYNPGNNKAQKAREKAEMELQATEK